MDTINNMPNIGHDNTYMWCGFCMFVGGIIVIPYPVSQYVAVLCEYMQLKRHRLWYPFVALVGHWIINFNTYLVFGLIVIGTSFLNFPFCNLLSFFS